MSHVSISKIIKDVGAALKLRVVEGAEFLDNTVAENRIQKTGLALTGFVENIHPGRIQIMGSNEIKYLSTLPEERQLEILTYITTVEIPAIIVTRNLEILESIKKVCRMRKIPLLASSLASSALITQMNKYLEETLAPMTTVHGVLMEVLGIGVLMLGKSGIGKSECALDLLQRGHRLVADDVVIVHKTPPDVIWGSSDGAIKYHMEVRGLGIINIKDLFGITAVRPRKRIELIIELVEWDRRVEYDRLGIETQTYTLLDVELPYMKLPITNGKNIASIVEVATRNFLLRIEGHLAGEELAMSQIEKIAKRSQPAPLPGFHNSSEVE